MPICLDLQQLRFVFSHQQLFPQRLDVLVETRALGTLFLLSVVVILKNLYLLFEGCLDIVSLRLFALEGGYQLGDLGLLGLSHLVHEVLLVDQLHAQLLKLLHLLLLYQHPRELFAQRVTVTLLSPLAQLVNPVLVPEQLQTFVLVFYCF